MQLRAEAADLLLQPGVELLAEAADLVMQLGVDLLAERGDVVLQIAYVPLGGHIADDHAAEDRHHGFRLARFEAGGFERSGGLQRVEPGFVHSL